MAMLPLPATLLTLLGGTAFVSLCPSPAQEPSSGQEEPSEFASGTIDLGVVVGDLDASLRFYKDLIGFTEVPGFAVTGDFCESAGLTDGHGVKIHVLVLNKNDTATRIKLMALPAAKPRASDNTFIHSQLGFSYLTLRTTGLKPALARLDAAGVAPLGQGPVPLPGQGPDGAHIAVVRDPDGNLVELIGTN
jgi:catechol 2,3-dioxygenase-like lactoylglutathione lyase family enzyme